MFRDRLPSHLAWPVSRGQLKKAIGEERDGVRTAYFNALTRPSDTPIYVHWTTTTTAERVGLPAWSAGISIGVSPIEKSSVDLVRPLVVAEVLPDLAAWVHDALGAAEEWKDTTHTRKWCLLDGRIVAIDGSSIPHG